jgi:phosphoribosylformylglycinamidine cyclo-ligase
LAHYTVKDVVHGIAHITGGGLLENLARIIPEGRRAVINRASWQMPTVFNWLQRLGEVDQAEMDQVFNMGVGMALVVSPYYAESIRGQLADCGCESWLIGQIVEGDKGAAWE